MVTDVATVPAVQYVKEMAGSKDATTLSTGARVLLTPVGGGVLTEISQRIVDPEMPTWHNPDKDTDEPNPLDPDYLRAVAKANQDRALAVLEAIMLLGVELVDGVPGQPFDSDVWVRKLKYLGIAKFDENDPFERQFAYVRYMAVGASDYPLLGTLSGVTEAAVRQAQAGFRSPAS